jgi:membrane-bound ClpP family serine protease
VNGALWKAVASSGPIAAGSAVQVVGRQGLKLEVVADTAPVMKEKE